MQCGVHRIGGAGRASRNRHHQGLMIMTRKDQRGYHLSGASPADSNAFDEVLASHLSWQGGAEAGLHRLIAESPRLTMAHVLEAYLGLCSRDVARVQRARLSVARA